MMPCDGTIAEQFALPYVEGTLPEFEAERFEEHYSTCPVCLDHVKALLAIGEQLRRQPIAVPVAVPVIVQINGKAPVKWPTRIWALGAVGALAAMLVMSVIAWRIIGTPAAQPAVAQNAEPADTTSTPAAKPGTAAAKASELADLALPAFAASSLRGDSPDEQFEVGMKAYSRGDCRAAVSALAMVPAATPETRASQFYLGACQMHLDHRTAAAAALRKVAEAGDSPQQEAALYYLAQVSLLDNNLAQAHRYLTQTIALRGDLLVRARTEDRRVKDLIGNRTANAR